VPGAPSERPRAPPTRNKGWEEMPKLAKLRFYDLRHQAITEMLEAGVPEGVIREITGHVDPAMTQHYSHPRLVAPPRRAAVETLVTTKMSPTDGGHVTNHVTRSLTDGNQEPQVIEKVGTPGVIRTPDTLLRRQVLYPAELRAHEGFQSAYFQCVISKKYKVVHLTSATECLSPLRPQPVLLASRSECKYS
jgi:Phage integrase family